MAFVRMQFFVGATLVVARVPRRKYYLCPTFNGRPRGSPLRNCPCQRGAVLLEFQGGGVCFLHAAHDTIQIESSRETALDRMWIYYFLLM